MGAADVDAVITIAANTTTATARPRSPSPRRAVQARQPRLRWPSRKKQRQQPPTLRPLPSVEQALQAMLPQAIR